MRVILLEVVQHHGSYWSGGVHKGGGYGEKNYRYHTLSPVNFGGSCQQFDYGDAGADDVDEGEEEEVYQKVVDDVIPANRTGQ